MSKCPSAKTIADLRQRAYKMVKAIPYARRRAYKDADTALRQAVLADGWIKAAHGADKYVQQQYCAWASGAVRYASELLKRAQRANVRYGKK
jgi:hypothetical protein